MNERRYRAIEFILWVATVTIIVVSISVGIGLITGGGLLTAKYILFTVGFLLFGVSSLALQPKKPHHDKKRISLESQFQSRLEKRIQRIPPLRNEPLAFDRRIRRAFKSFVTSLLLLGISFFMEFGLGIGIGPVK